MTCLMTTQEVMADYKPQKHESETCVSLDTDGSFNFASCYFVTLLTTTKWLVQAIIQP